MDSADRDISERAVRRLFERKSTLSLAESCTGGLIGKMITDVAGSSSVFWGGFLLYSNEAKIRLAGVNPEILREFGAVSGQTVEAMAAGTAGRCQTDYALAVSGVAGPGGGTPGKPVGTVWIGLYARGKVFARGYHFPGDRDIVRKETAREALSLLIRELENEL